MDQKELEEAVKRLYEDAPFYYTKEMLDAQAEKLIREWEKENPGPYLPINLDGFYNTVTKKSLIPTINTSLTSNESTLKEGEVAVVETKKRTWDDILTDDKIITPEIQPSITTGSVVTPEIIQTQEIAGLKDEDEIVSYGTYRYDPNKKVWVHSYEKSQVDEKGKQVLKAELVKTKPQILNPLKNLDARNFKSLTFVCACDNNVSIRPPMFCRSKFTPPNASASDLTSA